MTRSKAFSEMTTVEEILNAVVKFDRVAHEFFLDLVPKVSKSIRYVVEELAQSELDHINRIQALVESPGMQGHMQDAIRRPEADRRFSDAIQTPELGEHPDDQAVLQYALALEQVAIDEYSELAANTPPGPLHEAFVYLANEEAKHKSDLEALYYEIVHSGGV